MAESTNVLEVTLSRFEEIGEIAAEGKIKKVVLTHFYPQYDKVYVYDEPYDYTYLRTLEALSDYSNWTLEETDKEKGVIVARNTEYGHLFDHDKWVAKFLVKRISREQTSVQLDEPSQQLEVGGELLQRIDAYMQQKPKIPGGAEQLAAAVQDSEQV